MASNVDWKDAWNKALKDPEIFPVEQINDKSVSVSCPTRFSNSGAFSIQITPTFREYSIGLEILTFNDNLSLKDLPEDDTNRNDFNSLSNRLVMYELSNRLLENFDIKSEGFKNTSEAAVALVDYINNKATESGRMFDDKLDELNDIASREKLESCDNILLDIVNSRRNILTKVENILKISFGYRSSKNESFCDSVIPLFDRNGNLSAVVSIVDDNIIIDLAEGITSKVSMLQSDEDIEKEIVSDVENSTSILADREIEHLKEVVASNPESDMSDVYDTDIEDSVFDESLAKRVARLENLYILHRLRRFK